jgi:hypothetical protein
MQTKTWVFSPTIVGVVHESTARRIIFIIVIFLFWIVDENTCRKTI